MEIVQMDLYFGPAMLIMSFFMEIDKMELYFGPAVSMTRFYGNSSIGVVFWPSSEYN